MPGDEEAAAAGGPQFRLVGADRVRVEFMIDDLVRRIKTDGLQIEACNGCNTCSAVASTGPEAIQ